MKNLDFYVMPSALTKIINHFGCTEEDIEVKKIFSEGMSGNGVLYIRVVKARDSSLVGDYVLKLFESADDAISESANTFQAKSTDHLIIPELRLFAADFYLYDTAGSIQLSSSSLAKMKDVRKMSTILGHLFHYLLSEWTPNCSTQEETVGQIIKELLGEEKLALGSRLIERIRQNITDELTPAFSFDQKAYVNPVLLLLDNHSALYHSEKKILSIRGRHHGDLNLNNVFFDTVPLNCDLIFYLIDFEKYQECMPLMFDEAYVLFCALQEESTYLTLPEWITKISDLFSSISSEFTIPNNVDKQRNLCICQYLDEMKVYLVHQQTHNRPSLILQCLAAHVAVGLNFLNKRQCTDRQQKMALIYASLASETLYKLMNIDYCRSAIYPNLQFSHENISELWEKLDHCSDSNRYVLITSGNQDHVSESCIQNLAPIRWSLVIEINTLLDNPLRDSVFPIYKKIQGYRYYEIPCASSLYEDSSPAWLHIVVPNGQKNLGLYYRSNIQNSFEKIVKKVLLAREGEPLYIISNLSGIDDKLYNSAIQDIISLAGEKTFSHVIALNGQKVDLDSDGLITCSSSNNTIEDFARNVFSLRGSTIMRTEPYIPGIDGPVMIASEKIANFANDFELVFRRMTKNLSDDGGDAFFRGSPASWNDIESERDVIRYDYRDKWKTQLESKIENLTVGSGTIVRLMHRSGGGGTTLSKRIAWDFCAIYPSIILRHCSAYTADRLKALFDLSKKPILAVCEISDGDVSFDAINNLRRELINKNIRILFLCVTRCIGKRTNQDNSFFLPDTASQTMGQEESEHMLKAFSAQLNRLPSSCIDVAERETRLVDLQKLTYLQQYEDLRHPFFYGLFTYKSEFQSISSYVQHNSINISDAERKTLYVLSLLTACSQTSFLTFEETALFLFPDEHPTLKRDAVRDWMYNNSLVTSSGRGLRICHPVIAEEILFQNGFFESCTTSDSADDRLRGSLIEKYLGTDKLVKLCCEFVDVIANNYDSDSERRDDLFREIFTHRETVNEEEPLKFSSLLTVLYSRDRCIELISYVCSKQPNNPHFSNLLSRIYLYPISPNQKGVFPDADKALIYANEAILKAEENKLGTSIHYHLLGKVHQRKCIDKIRNMSRTASVAQILNASKRDYQNSRSAFNSCIYTDKSGYGLTGVLELITGVLQSISNKKHTSISNLLLRNNEGRMTAIAEMIADASDSINRYSELFDTTTAVFRTACVNYFSLIGKLNGVEQILYDQSASLKEQATVRRAMTSFYMRKTLRDNVLSYDDLTEEQLRNINRLMQQNISSNMDNESDRIRWFESYRRLPEFDLNKAYSFLMDCQSTNNINLCYYRYVLAFLIHYTTGEVPYNAIKDHETQTESISHNAYGKNAISTRDYFGKEGEKSNLLLPWSALERTDGQNDQVCASRFDKCQLFTGKIDSIINNTITIKFRCTEVETKWFYAKAPNVSQIGIEQIEESVSFHLGFSYSGFRAWDVEIRT